MRAVWSADRRDRARRTVRGVYEGRHEKGVAPGASRRHRHHRSAGGVSDAHAPGRGARLANHGPHGRCRGGDRLVPADLSHRAEDCSRMAEVASSVIRHPSSVWVAMAAVALLTTPLAAQTSLSIYGDGRVVVRRALPQALQKGRNTFTLRLEGLDGATLFSPDTAVALVSAVVRPPSTPEAALAAATGQTLSFVRPRDTGGADTGRGGGGGGRPPPQSRSPPRFLPASPPGAPVPPRPRRAPPRAGPTPSRA